MSLPDLARPTARLAVLLTAAALALPTGAALAQSSSPFGSLPAATPDQTTATTQTTSNSVNDTGLTKVQAIFIALGGVVVITGIGLFIARDARRRAPVGVGDSEAAHRVPDAHKRGQATKRKQRARAKAAREQRRRNR